jgi:sugar/nucleoside kinase (ribokinase family)
MCLDETPAGPCLGGTVAYAAVLARRLGLRVGVVTSAAPDLNVAAALPDLQVHVVPAPETTRFRNEYRAGRRCQMLRARAAPLGLLDVPAAWRRARVAHLAPVAREVDPGLAAALRPTVRFLGATPQGWLRDWDATGVIVPRPWDDLAAHLAPLDALVVSEEDLAAEPAGPSPLVAVGSLVALTRGAAGVRLIGRDGVEDVPACPARVHDPTGAGDVFAAAWFARLAQGDEPARAARYAACAAACAIERPGLAGVPTAEQIEERLRQWER